MFAFEALEPRLLLSGDLNAAAASVIHSGLAAFDSAVGQLASTTALTPSAPFINRSIGQVAALNSFAGMGTSGAAADPIVAIENAASAYFTANPTSPTISGLAAALNALSSTSGSTTVTATTTVPTNSNPNLETIQLTLTATSSVAATNTGLSVTASGHSLSTTQSLTQSTTQSLNLVFGVDMTTPSAPVFEVTSAIIGSNNEYKNVSAGLTGNATVDGTSETVAGGTADIVINVSESFAATPASPLTYTSGSNGFANAAQSATPTLTGTSATNPWINMTVVSSGSTDAAETVAAGDNLATPNSETLTVTPIPPSALETQVVSVFNDLNSEISRVESDISNATSFAFNLPFIGNQLANDLNPQTLFQPIVNEISSLKTQVKADLANSGSLLTTVQQDIVSALSSVGLLPDANPTSDVVFEYIDSDTSGTQTLTSSSSVDLTHVTQLEIDLTLGQTISSNVPVGANIGLPGLGLSLTQSSHVTASIGWTFDVGLGMTATTAYLVAGSSATKGSPVNFDVSFYLANGFQAVGSIAFLQALLTEPNESNPSSHTGIFGTIGVGIGGATGGTALNGGTQIQFSDISNLTATPNFSLKTQSELNFAFGADFQLDSKTGDYTDVSQFPSITGQLEFNWDIDGTSLSTGSLPSPTVGLNNIEIDLGTAITDFLAPILKPFYEATQPLDGLFNFLTSPMPVISSILSFASSSGVPAAVINLVLPSYDPSSSIPYDWLNFAVDMMADDGLLGGADPKTVAKIGNTVISIILDLDNVYSDISGPAAQLMIPLGNFDFSGKNLALPQVNVTNDSQIASLGDQVGNFSQLASSEGDSSVAGAIMGLLSGSPVGSAFSALEDAQNTIGAAGDAISNAASTIDGDITSLGTGSSESTSKSEASITFPFFENPDSILGLLFGQQVQFFDVSLGFAAQVTETIPLFAVSFFGILTAAVDLNLSLGFDVGVQFGYDSTGILDLIRGQTASGGTPSLLDGIFLAGDPLLANTSDAADVLKLDASVGVSIDASVLLGLLSVGIEGGIDLAARVYLPTATEQQPMVHYDVFSQQTTFDLNAGELGPFDVSASGSVFVALLYSTFWGFGPSGSIKLASVTFFQYPSPAPTPADIDPLGFYDPQTGQFDLYVGATANQRENNDGTPAQPLFAHPDDPQQVLENDSSTYVIDINSGNMVTVWWWNPQQNVWESQTPSGPVSEIIARTGDGNNTIIVNNLAPNTVETDFTGTGGVQYNADQNSTTGGTTSVPNSTNTGTVDVQTTNPETGTLIGGNDVFESGGGSSTLMGSNGNDVLVGSADPSPGPLPADSISGGNGNDTIIANTGNNTIQAGSGNSIIYAGTGNQLIENQKPPQGLSGQLQPGDIPPVGSAGGADTMPPGNDTVVVGAAGPLNVPFGPGGDENISGPGGLFAPYIPGGETNFVEIAPGPAGPGTSTFTFVDGTNEISYVPLPGPVNVNLGTGIATSPVFGTEYLTDFNIIVGSLVASTLTGGTASEGSDSIYGSSGADVIMGGGGNDLIVAAPAPSNPGYDGNTITGGTGNDVIYGGPDHDNIYGGTGTDSIIGGNGGSTLDGGTKNDTIRGGSGADYITSADGDNLITTGDGNDIVVVGNGNNNITAGVGNDSITGGNGNNSITGVFGNDVIAVGNGRNTIFGGVGNDLITTGTGSNLINGGVGQDTIVAGLTGTGTNTIGGSAGTDIIEAGNGNNIITGNTDSAIQGNDQILVGTGSNVIDGGDGDDIIVAGINWSAAGPAVGWSGNNSLIGGTGASSIMGGQGDDIIQVGNGKNTVTGGTGNDQILAGIGSNSILGGNGNDLIVAGINWSQAANNIGWTNQTSIIGGTGANSIIGGTGEETMLAGNGPNTLFGGNGDDLIETGTGFNSITGGVGNDDIYAGVIWLDAGIVVGGTGNNTIYGGTGEKFIEAGNGDNIIDGGIGDDVIISGFGDSTILGGTGNDKITVLGGDNVIQTGTGSSTVIGGTGSDLIRSGDGATSVQGGGGTDTISLGDGNNTVSGGAGPDIITVGNGNNFITGGSANNTIEAGSGTNVIFGGGGNNWIADGAGHAIIKGGGGNDIIYGGALSSTILGGAGNDVIVGGGGGNLIVGGQGNTTIYGGSGGDVIYGGAGDNLLISGGGLSQVYGDHVALAFALSALGVLTESAVTPPSGATNARATIYGSSGPDSLYGGSGSDVIYGGTGTRLIVGGKQPTLIYGG
ncbi:MAG TPA: calcium-binding protein, partial [Xanthobacteraceae bacterium]|nr:calcium-binding protein [Xanthobacteraceae bacterium]